MSLRRPTIASIRVPKSHDWPRNGYNRGSVGGRFKIVQWWNLGRNQWGGSIDSDGIAHEPLEWFAELMHPLKKRTFSLIQVEFLVKSLFLRLVYSHLCMWANPNPQSFSWINPKFCRLNPLNPPEIPITPHEILPESELLIESPHESSFLTW